MRMTFCLVLEQGYAQVVMSGQQRLCTHHSQFCRGASGHGDALKQQTANHAVARATDTVQQWASLCM